MVVRIFANSNAGDTEKKFHNVVAEVVGDYQQQILNKETPFILLRPWEDRCPLVKEVYVRKDCIG